MADFRPETTVYLWESTGVDEGNQPYFTSAAPKLAWYMSHNTHTYTQYSYQRENREYIRVGDKAEKLRSCDMMGFQNSEGRMVYCRILEIEFINPNCTEITYEVDYMQTYMEVIIFGKCWVEREMVIGDWDGNKPSWNNLQPEGIETGALNRLPIPGDQSDLYLTPRNPSDGSLKIVVLSAYDEFAEGALKMASINGMPSGLNAFSFNYPSQSNQISEMLARYSEKGRTDGIAAIFVGPADWMYPTSAGTKRAELTPSWNVIDGYEIINAKCFTSEFCNFELDNGRGNSVTWRPENFTETDNIIINLEGGFTGGGGGVLAYPRNYMTNPRNHGVVIPIDIQVPYVTNAFANWLAQNKASIVASGVGSIENAAIAGLRTGSVAAGVGYGVAGALNSLSKIIDKAASPLAIGGQSAGDGMLYITGGLHFTASLLCPYLPNLKSIDSFFTKYGYRTNMYKTPNINTRPKWNYVKTSGAVCRGPFSKKAQLYMENIMNNGTTFWHLSPGENITDDWKPEQNKE